MTAPPFALPVPEPRDAPAGAPPVVVGARERARRCAALAALGAAAAAATLAVGAAVAVFEADVVEVLARPATIAEGLSPEGLRELAGLPGPSPVLVAALLPAVALLLAAGVLRRLGGGAPPMPGASPEALAAAERTMAWAVRVIAAGAFVVFVVPALLELGGLPDHLAHDGVDGSRPPGRIPAPRDPAGRSRRDPRRRRRGDRRSGRVARHAPGRGRRSRRGRRGGRLPDPRRRRGGRSTPSRSPRTTSSGWWPPASRSSARLRAWMVSPLGIAIAPRHGVGVRRSRRAARRRRAARIGGARSELDGHPDGAAGGPWGGPVARTSGGGRSTSRPTS